MTREAPRPLSERPLVMLAVLGFAILIASTSPILVRWSESPNVVKVFFRLLFATAALLPVTLWRYRADVAGLGRRDLGLAVATGAVLAVHFRLWFESLDWTTVAASVTIAQTQVIFVAIGAALLLDERPTAGTVLGAVIGFGGVALITGGGFLGGALLRGADPLLGNLLALAGGALFAAYLLAGRSLRRRVATLPYLTVVYGIATVVTLGMLAVGGTPIPVAAVPTREWAVLLALALGPGVVTQALMVWALGYLPSSVVSTSLLAAPVASALLAGVLLGEVPGPLTLVGGTLVLLGIGATIRSRPAV